MLGVELVLVKKLLEKLLKLGVFMSGSSEPIN